jgi:NAD(P)-dependent dehydrogenase (short-subunit alcohol dehydrogenase family)
MAPPAKSASDNGPEPVSLSPKVFITGASSGIGAALAAHYAGQGAVLGLCARRLAQTQALLSDLGGMGSCYEVDVTDAPTLQAAAADFIRRFGVPDIVIANAGIGAGTLTENPEDLSVFRRIMDTNVFGMPVTFQPFVEAMRERASGTLVGIASVAAFRGLPGGGAYSASKSAAVTYLESLRVELHASGVSVVTICPGYIRTPLTAQNRYRMPFLIDADDAARRMARVIAARRSFAVIPWQMALVGFVLRRLPRWLYDRLFARAPRKARGLPP